MNLTITKESVQLSPGADVVLRQQSWADYEALLASRKNQSALKIYFNASNQEIRLMAPSPKHGNRSDALSDLVKSLLYQQGTDFQSFDPITLKKFDEAGVEPDACFYIANRQAILRKEKIDLAVDPPPDLALEVDLTSLTNPQDYESIAAPELWIYKGNTLNIYLLEEGQYVANERSPLFPKFDLKAQIPKYIELAWAEGVSVAVRGFEKAIAPFPSTQTSKDQESN
ncbi:Uma2 family endonuclease [cf. Phormidesmis sp. LEGE 11477]|uniref:Uma2 family endonuclease n=1 Tax=cf. Phormidesmis sp. LEGE 11477 TaxID=1828680 RepID=UPI00187F6065|nr:Uma2 family endonuclease [cf. Phormidesmis sp. LEGE 11477]MBE9060199.1 Uma2 family endonuclease [cf. Phormidesmis sp. LEGE 11477]